MKKNKDLKYETGAQAVKRENLKTLKIFCLLATCSIGASLDIMKGLYDSEAKQQYEQTIDYETETEDYSLTLR